MDLDIQYRNIQEEMDEAIFKVIRSYKFIGGPEIAEFEKRFAEKHDIKYCCGTSSGTTALHLAYEALNIKENDEVIIPAMTFIATSEPLKLVRAKPVFVDIDPKTYNIDPNKIENAITEKTKAIVVVHLHGNPAAMDKIMKIAEKNDLYVIEDCAQAHLAEFRNQKVGTFGDIATFSFYPGKNLGAYGDAGAVTTNNKKFYEKVKLLLNHGRKEKYRHHVVGFNYRMDTLQAAVLNVKLKYLEKWTEQRRKNAGIYNNLLNDLDLQTPQSIEQCKHVYHLYSIVTSKRSSIIGKLKESHISYGIHYPIPLHLQPAYSRLGYKKGDFPIAEDLADKFLSLPMYAELEEKNIKLVVKTIKNV